MTNGILQSVLVFEVDEIKNNRSISVRFVQWLRSRAMMQKSQS